MYLNRKFRSAAKEFEKKCKITDLSVDYIYPDNLSAEAFEGLMNKSVWEFFNFLVEEVKENGRDAIQYHEEPLREEYQKIVAASDELITLNPVLRSVNLHRVNSQTDDVFDVAKALGDEHDFQLGVISSYLPCDIGYRLLAKRLFSFE